MQQVPTKELLLRFHHHQLTDLLDDRQRVSLGFSPIQPWALTSERAAHAIILRVIHHLLHGEPEE